MAVTVVLSEVQRATLAALCDTFAPSIERDDDPTGFWGRSASDLADPGGHRGAARRRPRPRGAARRDCASCSTRSPRKGSTTRRRRRASRSCTASWTSGPDALAGLGALRGLTHLLFYAMPDPATRPQPQLGGDRLPGPAQRAAVARRGAEDDLRHAPGRRRPAAHRRRRRRRLGLRRRRRRRAARQGRQGRRRARGRRLLQRGRLQPARAVGLREPLPRRRHLAQTADGRIALMTGSNLGGGSTVNWTNCLRTYRGCARSGSATTASRASPAPDYDRILDAVSERVNVNDRCSDFNGPPRRRSRRACDEAGFASSAITRNADETATTPDLAGLMGFGDLTGAKLGTLKTYLQDAADAGARFVVDCRVERVLVEDGRAAGVEGTYRDEDGTTRPRRRARADGRRRRRARSTRRRCCCARASAARPPATTCGCIPRPRRRRSTTSRRRAGGARRRPGLSAAVRRRRGRLRLPDRDLARLAGRDRLGGALGVRRAAQGAHGAAAGRPRPSCC